MKKEKEIKETTIEDLPGVGAATAEKLKDAGYTDLIGIAVCTPGQVIEATGMTEATARKAIQHARNNLNMGFETGEAVMKKREQVIRLSTGSKSFDKLMDGGFETGAITECFGEFGSSKTQIAHILAVNCIKQFPDSTVFFIDTESTFRPERIKELAAGVKLDSKKALLQIRVVKVYNSDHQMLMAEKIDEMIKKENLKAKLIIVDSMTAHFRADYVGRGTLADRQQKLNRHVHVLSRLADTHNLCVYITNQVMAKPDTFFGDPTQAIGGHILAHASTFRIYLRKGKKGSRVAKLIDSPNLPDGEASFYVETAGLKDI